jgi:hypothetical protein
MSVASRRLCMAAAAFGALSSASCTSDDSSESGPSTAETQQSEAGVQTDAQRLRLAAEDVLADAVVTRSEIEPLFLSAIECLKRQGLRGTATYDLSTSAQLMTEVYITGAADEGSEVERRRDSCLEQIAGAALTYESSISPEAEIGRSVAFLSCVYAAYPELDGLFRSDLPYSELEPLVLLAPELKAASVSDAEPVDNCVRSVQGRTVLLNP